ncbi:MAG: membrane dipeptidase [Planctomycetota bacterium]
MSDRSAEGLEGAVDLHVDTLSRLVEVGGGFIERPDLQVGPERCRRGGVRLLCAACYTRDDDPSPGVSVEAMLELCEGIDADPRSRARRVTTTGELEALGPDEIGLLLTIENGRSLEGRIEPIEAWRRRGVRILGVTWNGANELGEGGMSTVR